MPFIVELAYLKKFLFLFFVRIKDVKVSWRKAPELVAGLFPGDGKIVRSPPHPPNILELEKYIKVCVYSSGYLTYCWQLEVGISGYHSLIF